MRAKVPTIAPFPGGEDTRGVAKRSRLRKRTGWVGTVARVATKRRTNTSAVSDIPARHRRDARPRGGMRVGAKFRRDHARTLTRGRVPPRRTRVYATCARATRPLTASSPSAPRFCPRPPRPPPLAADAPFPCVRRSSPARDIPFTTVHLPADTIVEGCTYGGRVLTLMEARRVPFARLSTRRSPRSPPRRAPLPDAGARRRDTSWRCTSTSTSTRRTTPVPRAIRQRQPRRRRRASQRAIRQGPRAAPRQASTTRPVVPGEELYAERGEDTAAPLPRR